jgi:hypothetical protein
MQAFGNPEYIAGIILLGSIAPLIALIFLTFRGKLPSVYGLFRPIEELAENLPMSRWGLPLQLAGVILMLAGFAMVTILLEEAGDRALALIAFALLLAAIVLIAFEGSFYLSINPWAAEETAKSGSAPEIFTALHHWMNKSLQMVYMVFALLAFLGYGWSFLRTGTVPAWGGWATISWSLAWLIFTLASQITLPAVVFLWPWVVGVMLIVAA